MISGRHRDLVVQSSIPVEGSYPGSVRAERRLYEGTALGLGLEHGDHPGEQLRLLGHADTLLVQSDTVEDRLAVVSRLAPLVGVRHYQVAPDYLAGGRRGQGDPRRPKEIQGDPRRSKEIQGD